MQPSTGIEYNREAAVKVGSVNSGTVLPAAIRASAATQVSAMMRVAKGLRKILEEEVELLNKNPLADITEITNSKTLYLLELSRMTRRMGELPVDPVVHGQIMELRQALSLNGEALKVHLEASRSVSETIKKAIRDEESDGTYTVGQ
jgi:flagellar biosynthesis/type III secretory pathway chaperone